MSKNETTGITKSLTRALEKQGLTLSHQQTGHVLAAMLEETDFHVLSKKLKALRGQKVEPALNSIAHPAAQGNLDEQELNTVLAALRFYQEKGMGEPSNRSDSIHRIATKGDVALAARLGSGDFDLLCDKLNLGVASADPFQAIRDLRHEGYAIVVWYPEELRGASRRHVEDRLVELGHQVIEDLADLTDEPDGGGDDENRCSECGADLDDAGDGYDGLCADCADRADSGEAAEAPTQQDLAQEAFASYNFGKGVLVTESDVWAHDRVDGEDDWTIVAYVVCDDDAPDADSHKVSFHAKFAAGTVNLTEAYAYWMENGSEIGSPGVAPSVNDPYTERSFELGAMMTLELEDICADLGLAYDGKAPGDMRSDILEAEFAPKPTPSSTDAKAGTICKKCGSPLEHGYCVDETCPFDAWPQVVALPDVQLMSQAELERKYGVARRIHVAAEIHSDDRVFEVNFDASSWFAQASDAEILALHGVEWRGDYEADAVAEHLASSKAEIAAVLDYCRRKSEMGFEVSINDEDAMLWLQKNRKGLWAILTCTDCDVNLVQAEEDEIRGMWDWLDASGNACAQSFATEEDAALDAVEQLNLM